MPTYNVGSLGSDRVEGTVTVDASGIVVAYTMGYSVLYAEAIAIRETFEALRAHGGPYTTYTKVEKSTDASLRKPREGLRAIIATARANNARRAQARPREDLASPSQHSDESLVESDTAATPASNWMTVYDRDARWCIITSLAGGHLGWEYLHLDDAISDPKGRFEVFVGGDGQDVQVRILLNDDGDLAARHPSFNVDVIGSYTLWPYASGDLARSFVWWSEQKSLWKPSRPTEWEYEDR